LLLEVLSATGRKHRARYCSNLRPTCTETRLRVSVSSKKFSGVIPPDLRFKREGGKAKGRVGLGGMEGRKWEGKKDEEGKEENGGKGGRIV
jgi:hypothetical protein